VCEDLRDKHRTYACREFLDGKEALGLPVDHVPQLEDVSDRIEPMTGFRYRPAAGLVPLRDFYGALADHSFWATQYVRHHSVPLYTPEPDVLHEVVGHATMLADPVLADLYELAGKASLRCRTAEELERFSKVFWFTVEFGVVMEEGELKAYGAGILSSYGEIDEFRDMELRPLDIAEMGTTDYDITHYQPVLYRAESLDEVREVLGVFLQNCTDESIDELRRQHAMA
jgi:phenylalanine-4-hydroxylase